MDTRSAIGLVRMLQILGKAIEKFFVFSIGLFLLVTLALTLFVTATMPHYFYGIEFSFLASIVVVLGLVALVALLGWNRFCRALDRCDAGILMRAIVIVIVVVGLCWVVMANVWPEWDSRDVEYMATCMAKGEMQPHDSYASRFPFQVPLAILIAGLKWVFRDASYQAFELLNIASVVGTVYAVRSLSRALFANDRTEKLTVLLMGGFLPLVFYCTFEYGNLISLPLAIWALSLQVQQLRGGGVKKGVCAVLLVCVAILLKSSMLLVLIGMIAGWLVVALKQRDVRSAILVVGALVLYVLCGRLTSFVANKTLGLESQNALPKVVWIAMGMQEGRESMENNPGWYNGYLWKYAGDEYTPDTVTSDANESLASSISGFVADPAYAVRFFVTKYCSEWCQPDYECLLASNWVGASSDDMPIMSKRHMSKPLHSIYYGKANAVLLGFMDIYQSALVLGATCLFFSTRRPQIDGLVPLLVCAGTALMYLFWEAQSQYVMHAYVLMVPYAACGLPMLAERIAQRVGKGTRRSAAIGSGA